MRLLLYDYRVIGNEAVLEFKEWLQSGKFLPEQLLVSFRGAEKHEARVQGDNFPTPSVLKRSCVQLRCRNIFVATPWQE